MSENWQLGVEPEVKDRAIAHILDEGLVHPVSAWERARTIQRELGTKNIFFDTAWSLIFSGVMVVAMIVITLGVPAAWRHTATVACAPLLFTVILAGTEMLERATAMYDLKQTAHFTIRQVTALRVMAYSLVAAVVTALLASLSATGAAEVLTLVPLGLAALFGCALAEVSTLRFTRSPWAMAVFTVVWMAVWIGAPVRFGEAWEACLASLNTALTSGIAIICAVALVWQCAALLKESRTHVIPA
ncbi:MAG: hypothetical protein LBN10_08870 [Propionibacteriaceae bacterium]|jgi:hypothetical protein|nr:hypothetical protein [Propionibacteriaceae bacterium]